MSFFICRNIFYISSSLFEIIITLITLALIVMKEGHWMRAEFVSIFCIMILVYSWDMRIISNVLSTYVNVNIRMYNFDDVQCTVIPSVAYGFVTGMNLQLC